jgi:hypothetical protein
MEKEIVISGYDKDVSWMSKLNSNIKQTIYRKGNKTDNPNEIYIEVNLGRCVHSFFNHIYENYDNLSDYTFFAQDYPFDHWENIIEIVNGGVEMCDTHATLKIGGYWGFHFNTNSPNTKVNVKDVNGEIVELTVGSMWPMFPSIQFGGGNTLSCHSNGTPQDYNPNINVDKVWDILFEDPKPNTYEFIPGGHFCITKEQAHLRDKEFYKKIIDLLIEDINSPWVIERLECYIFNPKYKTKI